MPEKISRFAILVRDMRAAQKRYFDTRDKADLSRAQGTRKEGGRRNHRHLWRRSDARNLVVGEPIMRRPINPVIPYPHEAIQHTRCVLALSMITVAISFLKPETLALLGDLGKQVEKVNRWIDRCADDTQKRRLSAGAKRDLDARFHILAGHVGDIQAAAGDVSRWTQWGAGSVGRADLP